MKKVYGSLAMLTATVLWGVAFSAQSAGMDHLGPWVFTTLRSITGVAALLAVIVIFDLCREKKITLWGNARTPEARKTLLAGGWWCGLVLTAASVCQQAGLKYTTAGKTGFLTALYIVIVPLLGLFLKRKANINMWLGVILALSGAYLLCGSVGEINRGEWFVISCSLIYALHILVIDHYAAQCDCIRLSCIQFTVVTLLAAISSLLFGESWQKEPVAAALPFWIFCGIGSSAIAFTLQMAAQKYLHPVTAALIMSLESVFAVIGGWIFLHEILSARELTGCAVIFAGVIVSQLPPLNFKRHGELCQESRL